MKHVRHTLSALALAALCFGTAAGAIGNIDVKAVDPGPGKMKEVRAAGYIDAPPAKVWKAVTDYGHYNQFMPRVKESNLERRSSNSAIATMKLDLPMPFSGTWYTNRYDENAKAMTTKWRMLKGSIKHTEGGWTLKPQGKGTHATYIVKTDLGGVLIPQVLQNEVTKRTLPDIFRAVERRARSL